MAEPKIRFYLHSKAASDGRRPVYLSVGIGEPRPVRQATGVVAHPDLWAAEAPHLDKRTDGYRNHNERFDDLRLFTRKLVRRLAEDGGLTNEAVAVALKNQVASYTGRPATVPRAKPEKPAGPLTPEQLQHRPLREAYHAWQQENAAEFSATYLAKGKQYFDWMEKFDPEATPASVDDKWVKRYTGFLVTDSPLYNNTIHQHINALRSVLQQAGLNTRWLKNKWKHKAKKVYLTFEELEQLVAWEPPATRPGLARQRDVFVARCLCGLRWSDANQLLRPHIRKGQVTNQIRLDQQKTRAAVQIPVLELLQTILDRYADWPGDKALPTINQQGSGAAIKEILQLAGIDAPHVRVRYKGTVKHEEVLPKWKAAATHTARHTYGALLAKMKIDPLTMRDLMGHGDLKSTMEYVHLEADATEQTLLTGWDKLRAHTD
ncbi:tyrosine-type recombinase/integrase [Hymenobacter negativus]|uniref:Tyrosine-type recombinase/integrase n=1 Tax=Hymenobacter negativus TaxID=2795026 RepID=A0ABS3QDC0_9BACT|nr:tyrosine-type recombinase/integrase [Hymenobacter negativus]MBO2009211.1 tyrosine-type recombinase/integrase [Hymenobacter negativus]